MAKLDLSLADAERPSRYEYPWSQVRILPTSDITMERTSNMHFTVFKRILLQTQYNRMQFVIILVVSLVFIGMPQVPPIDWDLYTKGFWSNIPQTYLNNGNLVSPPWGLILLLPYYLMRPAGARVLSVLTIGWLTYKREWPFFRFFAVVLSPYFVLTMAKSNMDILVIVFPILLWEASKGRPWAVVARGLSLSMLLLKPQCTVLLILSLLWSSRNEWKHALAELALVGLIVIPISLVGSPPLLFQWLNNILRPSPQNAYDWSINNISLTAKFGLWPALVILSLTILILFLLVRTRRIPWDNDQTISSLLLGSMYLLPYTSQQSFSSALAFIPSWPAFFLEFLGVGLGVVTFHVNSNIPLWAFSVALFSLMCYSLLGRKDEPRVQSPDRNVPSEP